MFSGVAQQIVARVGVREVAMVGMGVAAVGLLLLSRAPVDGTYVADVLPGLLVMSAGLGLTFVPLTLIATTGVTDADAGLASGIFNSSQQIGGALGLAILSTVAAAAARTISRRAAGAAAIVGGFHDAFAGRSLWRALVGLSRWSRCCARTTSSCVEAEAAPAGFSA